MRILGLIATTALFSTLAFADDWTGKLVDSNCHDRQAQQPKGEAPQTPPAGQPSCVATEQSTAFALVASDGKVYKLDPAGNTQVMTALRNRADRQAPGKAGDATKPADITAKVQGTMTGTVIKVDEIEIQ